MSGNISRRRFLKKTCFGLANVSVLFFLGCQSKTKYGVPRITTSYSFSKRNPSQSFQKPIKNSVVFDNYSKWLPAEHLEDRMRWNAIVIHHTVTDTGSASIIDRIHKNRGFDGLGYDFIINSGRGNPDGLVEVGYRWKQQVAGAHCRSKHHSDNYWNNHSIGIALIGNFEEDYPTDKQYESLAELIVFLKKRYNISDKNIFGHKQVPGCSTKCPGKNFSWSRLKGKIRAIS